MGAVVTRPQSTEDGKVYSPYIWRAGVHKYYAHCLMADGEQVTLTTRASSVPEASRQVHEGYNIEVVLYICKEDELGEYHDSLRKSLLSSPSLI